MIYFLLPHNYCNLYEYLEYITENNNKTKTPSISPSLFNYLFEIKEKINHYQYDWNIYKKYTNPCEYVHTVCPVKKKSISLHKPLSRSYFKLIEIYSSFHLNFGNAPIRTFHLAEGPGGFIEAIIHLRKCPQDIHYGMTLQDEQQTDMNIPGWKKTQHFLQTNPNVIIENGITGTGDILSLYNFVYCSEKYKSSMEFITGDGGFDFSENFNEQENNIGCLLFAQIAFALAMQKRGGVFVLKIFDFFMSHTIDLLYLLSSFYEKVYIVKPDTSRHANSEKYLVCIGFLHSTSLLFYPFLLSTFKQMYNKNNGQVNNAQVNNTNFDSSVIHFIKKPISYYFTIKLEEYNSTFGQQQIENIYSTLSLIESTDIKNKNARMNELNKMNIQKCIHWCLKYNVPYDCQWKNII